MLPSVLSLSLVFGMYYLRYKKLWPLILAHAFGNMFSFLALRYGLSFP
ncbi:MAG: CPBP family glutamic-type intramembrane protease [Flavobacteriales bacterium]